MSIIFKSNTLIKSNNIKHRYARKESIAISFTLANQNKPFIWCNRETVASQNYSTLLATSLWYWKRMAMHANMIGAIKRKQPIKGCKQETLVWVSRVNV